MIDAIKLIREDSNREPVPTYMHPGMYRSRAM
jgi:hypothetical protein